MMNNISILGSTGSIGRQSLDVIEKLEGIKVVALTAGTSVGLMAEQCRKFVPELAVMASKEAADKLSAHIKCMEELKAGNNEFREAAAQTRRVEVLVSASNEIPVQKVEEALIRAGSVENVLEDPAPAAVVTAYSEGCVSYSLRLWVKTCDYWDVYYLVNRRVKEIFDAEGIRMAYSHLNVHLEQ